MGVRRLPLALGAALAAALVVPAAAVAQGDMTTTTVSCTPPSILVGASTSCSATVQDTTLDGSTPSGALGFVSDTPGGDFQDPDHLGTSTSSCTLSAVGEEHAASCRLIYIPGTFGTGVHKITVSYPGDGLHEQSSGSGNLNVARHGTTTAIACAPGSLTLGAGTSSCVVTVTDTSDLASTPTGGVALSSSGGSFGPGCEALAPVGTDQASCTAAYTPTVPGGSSLTGTYAGDSAHETSAATAQVSVAAIPEPATTVKKKCKKKKRSASAAKKKCKKKRR